MFDIWAGHTINMDFPQYTNNQYLFVVDRLTGYIQAEKVPNQQQQLWGLENGRQTLGSPIK